MLELVITTVLLKPLHALAPQPMKIGKPSAEVPALKPGVQGSEGSFAGNGSVSPHLKERFKGHEKGAGVGGSVATGAAVPAVDVGTVSGCGVVVVELLRKII